MKRVFEVVLLFLVLFLIAYLFGNTLEEKERIALIPIKGTILPEETVNLGQKVISSSSIVEFLEKAENDKNIAAVLLEINSGGGSVVASREVVEKVKHLKKPVVAWIREVGASGAYWIASAADVIVADTLSMTGSIGVTASYLEFSELMEEYGVTYVPLKEGELKDIASPFKKISVNERKILEEKIKKVYDVFVEDVALNRNLTVENVEEIATGIYYLGGEAKELGLIDVIGFKQQAIDEVKKIANIEEEPEIVVYEEKPGVLDLISQLRGGVSYLFSGTIFRV